MIGAEALVPPTACQSTGCPSNGVLSKTQTPVFGSPTADTSLSVRARHPAGSVLSARCQAGLAQPAAQPEPVPFHAISAQPRDACGSRISDVPPTDVTNCDDAGNAVRYPLSPEAATMATPGWWKCCSSLGWAKPPQLSDTYKAPRATAWSCATSRSVEKSEFASTSRMWQFGQIAVTMSMSRDSSPSQPPLRSAFGSGVAAPFWLTLVTQPAPVAVSHAAKPHCCR